MDRELKAPLVLYDSSPPPSPPPSPSFSPNYPLPDGSQWYVLVYGPTRGVLYGLPNAPDNISMMGRGIRGFPGPALLHCDRGIMSALEKCARYTVEPIFLGPRVPPPEHTFMRSLMGRLNQFVLAPGSLTDISV